MSRSRWIDITGLPNGKYRLDLGANTSGWFLESDTTNNTAWAIPRIRKGRVNVLRGVAASNLIQTGSS